MLKSVSMDKNYDGIALLTRSYMCMGHILNHSKDRQNNMDGLWDLQNTHTYTHAYTHASSWYQKKSQIGSKLYIHESNGDYNYKHNTTN